MRSWICLVLALGLTACQGDDESTSKSTNAATCDSFDDQTPNQSVAIVYRNSGTQPIFVYTTSKFDPGARFTISDPSGADVGLPFGNCVVTCEALATGPTACDAGISFPRVIRLDPGGTYQESWNGLVTIPRSMPVDCYYQAPTGPTCAQLQTPAAGTYQAHALAGTSCSDCTCTPDSSGSCIDVGFVTDGGTSPTVSGQMLDASADATLPGATTIELAFATD